MHDFDKTNRLVYLLGTLLTALPIMSPAADAVTETTAAPGTGSAAGNTAPAGGAASGTTSTAGNTAAAGSNAATTPAQRVNINEYIVRGNTVLTSREIETAVYPFLGPQRTLTDVQGAQKALQQVYQSKGYQSVYVELPQQQVSGGVVYLMVTETTVGRVRVTGAKYHSPLAIRNDVPALDEGKVPNFSQVQQQLTDINRDGSRQVTPLVKEGTVPGTMDVDLSVADKNPWSGSLTVNNDYSADTKELRTVSTITNSNLWQKGYSASLTYFVAPQDRDNAEVWSGSYSATLDKLWTLRFSGYHSDSNVASVGGTNVLGKGYSYGAALVYSLPSTGAWAHSLSMGLDFKNFDENLIYGGSKDNVPLKYAPVTLSYNGYYFSNQTQGNLGLSVIMASSNFLGYGSDWSDFDYKRYKASPDFAALKGDAGITETFKKDWQLALSGSFQLASGPLVSNEQFAAGGATSVRGYLAAEQSADDGMIGSVELRTPSIASWLGSPLTELRLHTFADGAELWLRDALPDQDDRFDMASVGVGMQANVSTWLSGSLDLGLPLVDGPNTDKYDPRAQFSLSANF